MTKMSRNDFEGFVVQWQEYETTLTRILPRSLLRLDPDLSEEINHLLFCRDALEEDFARFPDDPKLTTYRAKMAALDAELLLRRTEILAHYPARHYRAYRKRNLIPPSHWWWYLDEIEKEAAASADNQDIEKRKLDSFAARRYH
jgi:hypothetical protein